MGAAPFSWIIWILVVGLEVYLLVLLCLRRIVFEYRYFTIYLCWQVFSSVPSMLVYRYSLDWYGTLYWFSAAVSWIAMFLVILELYDHSLGRLSGFRKLAHLLVLWSGIGLTAVVSVAVLFPGNMHAEAYQYRNDWAYLMLRSVSAVQAGLLLTLVLFLSWFRLRIDFRLRFLILGWLAKSIFGFVVAALRYELGSSVYAALVRIQPLVSIGVLLVWCWAIWGERGRQRVLVPAFALPGRGEQLVLNRLEVMNAALIKALRR